MKVFTITSLLLLGGVILGGCGSSSSSSSTTVTIDTNTTTATPVSISGKVTYDYVPSTVSGLDYTDIHQEAVKNVIVELVDASNAIIETNTTDANGNYVFNNVSASTLVKVRVSAKMKQTGTPSWDVKVVDNTNSDALYVIEGSLTSSGEDNSVRNLNAASGWGGSSYTSTRSAAPFAILDTVNSAMQKVLSADSQTIFPALQVNWSKNNISSSGDVTLGQIGTSYYTNSNLFILGGADEDTDEYDDHVIAHEWGHYYEDKFSRSDSIGGPHSGSDTLDIRVAFGEGWGNAFSAMALDAPVYIDTYGSQQATMFSFNVETEAAVNPGWYSESSVQRILYDLYDSTDDTNDVLSLGFGPIHDVFIGAEKNTEVFTSLFTFITALKAENSGVSGDIDSIVSGESIATITDIYGLNRTNNATAYPYYNLVIGTPVLLDISTADGSYNKLSNRKYVRFSVGTTGSYTITVTQTNGTSSDPDFFLYKTSPFAFVDSAYNANNGSDTLTVTLSAGSYLLDISDYNNIALANYSVSVN